MAFTLVAPTRQFILAGNARFTLRSKLSGKRFTFKVRQVAANRPHFVSLLSGQDNDNDYTFFGTLFGDGHFKHSPKSSIGPTAESVRVFAWFASLLAKAEVLPENLEVHHEGRCGRCGRALTVPESIESGFGPECINHIN